ncbi:Spindle pole body component alp4 [Elsinoe australis]|uniref:Spindle pole body component alp4 n=1 Tax=Elsinoe australis TaxID=40998 RepID=A0A2P7YDP1_9PEZI|nr:Spindle pole body component alp4 [Elsinoe australis]
MEHAQSLYDTYQDLTDELVRLNGWDRDLRQERSHLLSRISEIDSLLSDIASRRQAAASAILDQTNIDLDAITQAGQSATLSHTALLNGCDGMDYDQDAQTLDDNNSEDSLTREASGSARLDFRTPSEHIRAAEYSESAHDSGAELGAQPEEYPATSKGTITVQKSRHFSVPLGQSSSPLSDITQPARSTRPSPELHQHSSTLERRSPRQSGLPVLDDESGIPHSSMNHHRSIKFQSLPGFPSVVHSDWKDCYDLHCPGCHGNLTSQGNFVKGVAGMKAHIRQEHGEQYQTTGMSHAEVVELCCRRVIAADDKEKLKLKDDVLARLREAGMDEWVIQEAPLRRGPWKDGVRLGGVGGME